MANQSSKKSLAKQFGLSFLGFLLIFVLSGFLFLRATNAAEPESIDPIITVNVQNDLTSLSKPVRFLAVGDTGSGASFQRDIAKQMLAVHQQSPVSHLLLLGDIIYPHGEIDQYGESRYLKFYRPLMDAGITFKNVLGNHDVVNGYNPKFLDFYNMPGRYYQFTQGNVAFFAIDTNIINDTEQLNWLKGALAQSQTNKNIQWRVVFGHHPVFSTGAHGTELGVYQTKLKPLLEQYHVDFYLAGHDHNYERYNTINGVNYIVSGGGGAYLRDFKLPADQNTAVRKSIHHFLALEIEDEEAKLTVFDKHGNTVDTVVFSL